MIGMLFRLILVLATVLALAVPAQAQSSGEAVATGNVNLRQGPGTRYPVVRVLRSGERLDIARCSGTWCLVDAGRDRGWVAQAYTRRIVDARPPRPDITIGIGRAQACFYEVPRFRGRSFCLRSGQDEPNLRSWRNGIGSIELTGRVRGVDLCMERNFRRCTPVFDSQAVLSRRLQDNIVSLRVW